MNLPALVKKLLDRRPPPPLKIEVGRHDDRLAEKIAQLDVAPLVRAGLHLLNDDVGACHAIVQETENPDANYWHAILHRREGDFENALHWYARLGDHPVVARMNFEFPEWTPSEFVTWCRDTAEGKARRRKADLERIQLREMELLLDHVRDVTHRMPTERV